MMNGKNGLIADFVATFNSVRLHPARALCAFTSYFDILRFPVRYSAVLFRFMPFRVNGYETVDLQGFHFGHLSLRHLDLFRIWGLDFRNLTRQYPIIAIVHLD